MRTCEPCDGYGKIMGNGMIFRECESCFGKGKIEEFEDSSQYQNAVAELQTKCGVNKEEAVKIFKEESDKIDNAKHSAKSKGKLNVNKSRASKNR